MVIVLLFSLLAHFSGAIVGKKTSKVQEKLYVKTLEDGWNFTIK